MFAVSAPPAAAETAGVLPKGAVVVYGGLGVGTFEYGSSGSIRDRQVRARADLYGAWGTGGRVQLSLDLPVVHAWVIEYPDRDPCPTSGDYCTPVTTIGESGVHARYLAVATPVRVAVGLGARTDAWNAGTRARWTNVGLGTTSLVGSALVSGEGGGLGADGWASYALVFGREADVPGRPRLPADVLSGGVAGRLALGAAQFELAVTGWARLGGSEFAEWNELYAGSDDPWAGLAYRELVVRGKTSFEVAPGLGVHLSLGRVVLAANGPKDATDVTIGLHRYWPGR